MTTGTYGFRLRGKVLNTERAYLDKELAQEKLAKAAALEVKLKAFPERLEPAQNLFDAPPFKLAIEYVLKQKFRPSGRTYEEELIDVLAQEKKAQKLAENKITTKEDITRYVLGYMGKNFTNPRSVTNLATATPEQLAVEYEYTVRTLGKGKSNKVMSVLGPNKDELGFSLGLSVISTVHRLAPYFIDYLKSSDVDLNGAYKYTGLKADSSKMPINSLTYFGWVRNQLYRSASQEIIDIHNSMLS
jgi:hypothetical protein